MLVLREPTFTFFPFTTLVSHLVQRSSHDKIVVPDDSTGMIPSPVPSGLSDESVGGV